MVGDEDHGAVLDRRRDPLRDRLCALLLRLHVLQGLSELLDRWTAWLVQTFFHDLSDAQVAEALTELDRTRDRVLDGARISPGDTVVDVGAGSGFLMLGAVERTGPDGAVIAVDVSADALEHLRDEDGATNVSYLLGAADVLPLPDECVDVVTTRSLPGAGAITPAEARELGRVLRTGGRASIFEPIVGDSTAGSLERALVEAGFGSVTTETVGDAPQYEASASTDVGLLGAAVRAGAVLPWPVVYVSVTKP